MSYCLNPICQKPHNPDNATFCQACGSKLLIGERYRSLKPIAQGGFGRTFLAVDEHTDQPCVIKQQLPRQRSIGSQQAAELFRQEAERLAELGQHPQIPRLLAHYQLDDGQYLIQEFVSGENLEELLANETTFDEPQVRELLEELLPVLHFVHQHQVIHRDIKPENIIRPRTGAPYVLVDFGASKTVTGCVPQTGTVIGSAGYVAPEQAMGKAEFASDLYSLGVTCIHLLTGMHPFDLYSVSDDAWIWRQYLRKPLSSRLRQVLDQLLQKPTRQRYHTAQEVWADLHSDRLSPSAAPQRSPRPPVPRQADRPSSAQRTGKSRLSPSWRCVRTLTGHDSSVTTIAISPRGHLLASSSDKTIKLWRLATGELLHTFPGRSLWFGNGHSDRINALVFSPDSKVLISGSDDGSIKHWNLTTQELITTLPGHGWGTSALALSPDGYALASGDRDGKIHIWDAETDEPLTQLSNHHEQISALLFGAGGHILISSSYDHSICIWDWEDDHLIKTLRGHLDRVSAIALTPDGSTLISASWDKTVKLWHVADGEQLRVFAAHQDRVNSLAVSPDGTLFASASEDGTITLWEIKTGDRLCTLRHAWGVNAIAFSPNGGGLVSSSADETIQIWQPQ